MDPSKKPPVERLRVAPMPTHQGGPAILSSDELMQGATELQISHRGEVYRLRLTRSGKLILQK
jgi:hemin uptake protein HemP